MKRGEITIFLSLLLSCVCALLCIIIESARSQAMRLQIEILMDAGLRSCFSEYHQELFERYDLLYIDSSYLKSVGNVENVSVHLERYLNENIMQGSGERGRSGDWFKLSVEGVQAKQYLLATDFDGHAFRSQAVNYLRNYGDSSHCSVTEQGANEMSGIDRRDFYGEWEAIHNEIDGYGKTINNPAEEIRDYSSGDLLELVAGDGGKTLFTLPYQEIPSKRSWKKGNQMKGPLETENAEALFDEYMLQKCAEYTDVYENRVLNCELEYILYGNSEDRENLEQAAQELMEIRECENLSCLLSDNEKIEKAEMFAKQLVGSFGINSLTEAVRDSIIYAWTYAESSIEVSRLLSGGKVMMRKQPDDWILPLEELPKFREHMRIPYGHGLTYEEYLGILLRSVDANQKIARCMDLIEMNIRKLKNQSFRIDGCIEYLDAEVFFESEYGYHYQIRRDFGYELQYRNNGNNNTNRSGR